MNKHFSDMRDILICYANSDEDPLVFSYEVRKAMGVSSDRKIQALCYLFDNLLTTNAQLVTRLMRAQEEVCDLKGIQVVNPAIKQTKEDAFTALQMAITAQAANYQNGTNE